MIIKLFCYDLNLQGIFLSLGVFICGMATCNLFCRRNVTWKWRVIQPSMVTHTQNLCSAFTQVHTHTHTAVNTNTSWTHIRSSGQPFMLQRPGSNWGFGALLKGTLVIVLRVEEVIHFSHLQSLPARDSNSRTLDYQSNALTVRPWLPYSVFKCTCVYSVHIQCLQEMLTIDLILLIKYNKKTTLKPIRNSRRDTWVEKC